MPKTGATRYQKFLKSEKAKTKLKSKKELPKGTNVTKINFKVKKIILKEQLKKYGEDEILSSRKLNLNDLLSRLNHYNVNSRMEALNGIKELISSNTDVLEKNLLQLIHGVTPLIMNIEKKVRQESLKLMHLILSNTLVKKVEPFFDILSTYLRSAMTHIDSRIQEDSLLFLDILLLCTGEKMAQYFHKIIPNFLDMISKLRVDVKPGRQLTVNLNSEITSIKWRVNVLHRLQQFLHKYVELNKPVNKIESLDNVTYFYDKNKFNQFPLFNPKCITIGNKYFSSNTSNSQALNEIEICVKFIETLLPLLFETWLEVCPNLNKDNSMETVIMEDAAILLKHILQIVNLMWLLVDQLETKHPSSNITTIFCNKCKHPFSQHILSSFPYITNVRSKKNKLLPYISVFEDSIANSKLTEENLTICYLFIILNPRINATAQGKKIDAVIKYIENSLNKNTDDNCNELISKILNTVFSHNLTIWNRNSTILKPLFNKIILNATNKSQEFNQNMFDLLCKIALNDKLAHFYTNELYVNWTKDLPKILLQESVTVKSLGMLREFAVRNNKVFNNSVKPILKDIINNLPKIKVIEPSVKSQGYSLLFSLLYWVKQWDSSTLDLIEKQLTDNKYSAENTVYIVETLKVMCNGIFE